MPKDLQNKKFVYHRALNTQEAFRAFLELNANSVETLAAEGDICWAYIEGEFVIYMHHPDAQGKSLSNETIVELLAQDKLFTLEKLLLMDSEVNFILELKTGNGPLEEFLVAFRETLEKYDVKNTIVDAFSVEQLRALKLEMPDIKTSLHTKFMMGRYVAETTFERPYFRLHNLYALEEIDYVTISYTTTHVKLFNLDIDSSFAHLYKAGKKLNLGSIKSMDSFEKAINSKAEYLYLRSEEVRNNYTEALR